MHVLQILHDREHGGVQKLAASIESGLSGQGIRFETAYLYPELGLSNLAKFGCLFAVTRRIWRGDYDALLAYQSTASILAGLVGWLAGCRLRVVHQTAMPRQTPRLLRWLDRLAGMFGLYNANILNSAASWAEFANYPARYRRSIALIEHGLEAPTQQHPREATRRRFALPPSQPILLNVGRLAAQKNQDILIRALACLPHVHLAIAGGGSERDSFRALAVTLGVEDRLHLLGALPPDDIADLYAAADLFVFPSTWETFGLAAAEAAIAGLPMVVADLPVLRKMLGADGAEPVAFVAPDDTEGWIAGIAKALAAPPSASIAAAFARTLGRKYPLRRMIESYRSLFEAHRAAVPAPWRGLQTAVEKAQP
jgi:glycosyltransferase involved in cell wall biosynthesis